MRDGKGLAVARLNSIPQGLGYLEWIGPDEGDLTLLGWMLRADLEHDALLALLDGVPIRRVERLVRRDVAAAFPGIPHAAESGFRLRLGQAELPHGHEGYLQLYGMRLGSPVFRHGAPIRSDLDLLVPTPPPPLMARVGGASDPCFFKLGGLAMASIFREALATHCGEGRPARLLDWGCGCGRLLGFAAVTWGIPDIQGCDIDSEAIDWCKANYPRQSFAAIGEMPPMPYAPATFDAVIGYSVFTHLGRRVQDAWLEELHRVLVPGGLLLVTVHGDFAAGVAFGKDAPPAHA